MKRIFGAIAVMATGAALMLAVVMPAMASASASAVKAPVVHSCAGKALTAPRSFTLFCGDGNDRLLKLKWKGWGAKSATATGKLDVNLCTPDCAAGKDKAFPVHVEVTEAKGGSAAYKQLTLKYTGKKPKGAKRTEHFKLTGRGPIAR